MPMVGRWRSFAAMALVAVLASACGGAATGGTETPAGSSGSAARNAASSTAKPTPVTAAWVAISANQTPIPGAEMGGYFKQQGLDVHVTYIQGSETSMAALLSGEIQFAQVSGQAVVAAAAKGAPVRMVASWVSVPVFYAMTTKAIQQPSQLRGTTWAITRTGNADYFALLNMLKHFGLKASDVKMINAGSTVGEIAAVTAGRAQGVMESAPNNVLAEQQAGMHQFFDTSKLGIKEQNAGLATTVAFAQAHPQVVERFIEACIEAIHRFKTDESFANQVMGKYMKYQNAALLKAGWTSYAALFNETPYPSQAGMQTIINEVALLNPKVAKMDPATLIDRSFVQRIVQNGFIKKVYGS